MRQVSGAREWDTARLVRAGSAVAVGGFGWLLAHVVTFWFVAHSHHGAMSAAARHVHSYTAAAAAAAGGLAVASLLAIALTSGGGRSPGPRRRYSVHGAVGLSTAAFLVADAVEHAVLGLEHTPPVLVLLGAGLHALFGAGSSLLWLGFVGSVQALLAPFGPAPTAGAARRARCGRQPRRARRMLWAYAVAGRAPPIG